MPDAPRLIRGLTMAMRQLSLSQRVIANNIANSDTPGYKARTVDQPDFQHLLSGKTGRGAKPAVQITSGMAALGARVTAANGIRVDPDVSETKPNGNNVTLEDQLLALGQVQADFATMTNLYRKQMSMLRTAIGRGSQ